MTPCSQRILRMYLKTACFAAVVIQIVMLASIAFGWAREETFTTSWFRREAVLSICAFVLILHRLARAAYHHAVSTGDAVASASNRDGMIVSEGCPVRFLVIAYLGFTGQVALHGRAAGGAMEIGTRIADHSAP